MKIYFKALLVLFLFLRAGCKDGLEIGNKLDGTWELRHRRGGFVAPGTPENYPAGNGDVYRFEKGTFMRYSGNKLVSNGNFRIVKDSSDINGEQLTYKIELIGTDRQTIPFRLSESELVMHFGMIAADGMVLTYVRTGDIKSR